MKIIDISWQISGRMTGYKDSPEKRASIIATRVYSKHGASESRITLSSHTGTHVDAPKHFLPKGKPLDKVPLETFMGPCKVLDFTRVKVVTARELSKRNIKKGDIVLLKTKNSRQSPTALFNKDFVYLDKTGASYLASKKIKTVGIDYLGIETKQPGHETHKTLLKHNIGIIEGLRLKHVPPGKYSLVCLPLKIPNIDAAPARAVLIK